MKKAGWERRGGSQCSFGLHQLAYCLEEYVAEISREDGSESRRHVRIRRRCCRAGLIVRLGLFPAIRLVLFAVIRLVLLFPIVVIIVVIIAIRRVRQEIVQHAHQILNDLVVLPEDLHPHHGFVYQRSALSSLVQVNKQTAHLSSLVQSAPVLVAVAPAAARKQFAVKGETQLGLAGLVVNVGERLDVADQVLV